MVTSENSGNLRVCGFGNGGRLGQGQHTQYTLKPLPTFTHKVKSVALGQDHTLALTESGEVLSWGLNRFSQLGYIVEPATSGAGFSKIDEPIQTTPRKVQGPLKKQVVKGVAASKGASACWTKEEVYTWGSNNGQLGIFLAFAIMVKPLVELVLGYDRAAHPVQVLPRVVTKVTAEVLSISLTVCNGIFNPTINRLTFYPIRTRLWLACCTPKM